MNLYSSCLAEGARERMPARRPAANDSSSFTHARRRAFSLLAGVALFAGCQSNTQRVEPNAERIERIEQAQAAMVNRVEKLEIGVGDVTTELAAVKVVVTANSVRTTTNDIWPWVAMVGICALAILIRGWIRGSSYAVQKPIYEAGLPAEMRRLPP